MKQFNEELEDYINFLDEMEPEFNKYQRTLKNERANACNSTFFSLALDSFSDKKMKIKKELNDLEKRIKAFDEYMQFLDEMEKSFNQYDKSIKKMKEKYQGKRGEVSIEQIHTEQRGIRESLLEMERNAKEFDKFSKYYAEKDQEIRTLYSRVLTNFDTYLNPQNRVSFNWKVFAEQKTKIRNLITKLEIERTEMLKQLREGLNKRNLNVASYLAKRNRDESTISSFSIQTILNSIELMNQIDETLSPFGLTLEDFLKLRGKLLIDMKNKELVIIHDMINNYINNTTEVNFTDVGAINFEDVQDSNSVTFNSEIFSDRPAKK